MFIYIWLVYSINGSIKSYLGAIVNHNSHEYYIKILHIITNYYINVMLITTEIQKQCNWLKYSIIIHMVIHQVRSASMFSLIKHFFKLLFLEFLNKYTPRQFFQIILCSYTTY